MSLLVLVLAGAFLFGTAAASREDRRAAERVAAAHVSLMSAITASSVGEPAQPADNAAVAVLRAAAFPTSGLAVVPGQE